MRLLHDRAALADLFAPNPGLHLYSLGDLDDAYWHRTTWYADGESEVVLQYAAPGLPVVLAFTERPERMRALLRELEPFLPRRFYAHLSPGLADVLAGAYRPDHHGDYTRMLLADGFAPGAVDTAACEALDFEHVHEVKEFYQQAYPGNWFDPAMLHTGHYFGIRRNGRLAAVAGVHVFSGRFKVAALGNIATHPDHRAQGLGTAVTARLCKSLLEHAHVIGLNVRADNRAALACYSRLGFVPVAPYEEIMFTARTP
jgi:GNAT superfamily N-acetyltransferase